jgi:hypothetical protein
MATICRARYRPHADRYGQGAFWRSVQHLFGRHVRDGELILLVTWSRPLFLSQAIKCCLGQTYPNKELIVVVDSGASVAGLVPDDAAFTDIKLEAPLTLGAKLNLWDVIPSIRSPAGIVFGAHGRYRGVGGFGARSVRR